MPDQQPPNPGQPYNPYQDGQQNNPYQGGQPYPQGQYPQQGGYYAPPQPPKKRKIWPWVLLAIIIVIIAVRDMVKWALIDFYLEEMRILEDAIGARVGQDNATIRFAHNWPEYRARRYVPVFKRFALLFVLFLLCFPGGILFLRAEYLFAGLYLAVFAVVLAIYVSAARALQWI
jgi:hypothetical protein